MDFFYDGLGRLMAKVAPVDATCTPDLNGPTCVVEVDYYYDGFRRIQEAEFYEPETALYLGLVTPDPIAIYRERDYVYGPDYIDEFICQYDETGAARLMLQDGSYNVVAMETPSNVEQYVFSPYGVLLAADNADANRVGHQGLFFERFSSTLWRSDRSVSGDARRRRISRSTSQSPCMRRARYGWIPSYQLEAHCRT